MLPYITYLLPLCLASMAHAINMTFWNPLCGVDYAFGPYYEE